MLKSEKYQNILKARLKRMSSSTELWKDTLSIVERFYKYNFVESVLIGLQKPDATACAEIPTWQKAMNRTVKYRTEGITLVTLDGGANSRVRTVYDVTDTVPMNNGKKVKSPYYWTVSENEEPRIYNVLKTEYGVDGIDLEEALTKIVTALTKEYIDDNKADIIESFNASALSELDDFAMMSKVEKLVTESTLYTILKRCGIDYDADFSDLWNFDTAEALACAGEIVSTNAEAVLRSIEKEVKRIKKEEYYNDRRENDESDRGRGGNLPLGQENTDLDTGTGRSSGSGDREVRNTATQVSEGKSQGASQYNDSERNVGESSEGDRRSLLQSGGIIHTEERRELRSNRGTADEQPDGMGGENEHSAEDGRGNDTGTDLRIIVQNYGYDWDGMEYYETEKALEMWDIGCPVFMLYPDNSEHLVESREEIENFDGYFGVERADLKENKKRETAEVTSDEEAPAVSVLEGAAEKEEVRHEVAPEPELVKFAEQFMYVHKHSNFADEEISFISEGKLSEDYSAEELAKLISSPSERYWLQRRFAAFVHKCEQRPELFTDSETDIHKLLADFKSYNDSKTFIAYRKGAFYEFKGDEAIRVAELLDLMVTYRDNEAIVGIPDNSYNEYYYKLADKGYMMWEYSVLHEYKLPEIEPIIEGEPTVTIGFSEHPIFYDYAELTMSFKQADKLFDELDRQQQEDRQNEELRAGWYHKTDFTVNYNIDGEDIHYEGRYDIGDGDGGIYQHIKSHIEYISNDNVMKAHMEALGEDEYNAFLERNEYAQNVMLPYLQQFSFTADRKEEVRHDVAPDTLPDLSEEGIKSILLAEKHLKNTKSDIVGFFLKHKDGTQRADYIKSSYIKDTYIELLVGEERYGYKAEDDGFLMWEGAYLSRTAETKFSWRLVSELVSGYIDSHEYYSLEELESQAEYIDIEPEKEVNHEQLSFFDFDAEAYPTAEYTVPVEAINPEHINNLLRCGAFIENNSLQTIVAFYKKTNKTDEDLTRFVKSHFLSSYRGIKDTAIGFESMGSRLSAYFNEEGLTIKPGDTVFSVMGRSRFLDWKEVALRIKKMLEEGTYTEQAIIDSTREYEVKSIAYQLWEIWRERNSDEWTFELENVDVTHTTSCLPRIEEKLLNDREWLEDIANTMKYYAQTWQMNKSIQRFNGYIYNPVTVAERLNDLLVKENMFVASDSVPLPAQLYINTDHIEMYFRKHGHYENGKQQIQDYFTTHVDKKAQASFIKGMYGNGGSMDGEFDFTGYGGKGADFSLRINHQTFEKKTVSWNECAKIIYNSIKSDRYDKPVLFFSAAEKEEKLLAEAQKLINDYCHIEFQSDDDADYSDLSNVNVAYTNTEDGVHEIQASINFIDYRIVTAVDDVVVRTVQYDNLADLVHNGLTALDFDELTAVSDEELSKIRHRVVSSEENAQPSEDYTSFIGKEFVLEGRKYKVTEINQDTTQLQDLTMLEEARYPIFRSEHTSIIMPYLHNAQTNVIGHNDVVVQNDDIILIDYVMPDDNYSTGGAKTRFKDNVEAIRLLKKLEAENRLATEEEQRVLAKYVGFGGLSAAFNEGNNAWANEFKELSSLLSPEEYESALASTLTAFYTNPTVIGAMYEGLARFGFDGGNILEPAMGTGNFFGCMPEAMRNNSHLHGVELDSITGGIAKQLYQTANISVMGYEKKALNDNFFDLAIGNVPFGQFKLNDRRYNRLNLNIHDYFFAKSLDKVRPGGYIAFITTSGTLDKNNSRFRQYLAERAELVGAIRLPNNAFGDTEVTSDIIILKKRDKIVVVNKENCNWLEIGHTADGVPVNRYFAENPFMIMGEMKQGVEYSLYGNADATACVAPQGYDLVSHLHDAFMNMNDEYIPAQINAEEGTDTSQVEIIPADDTVKNFSFAIINDKVYYRENSLMQRVTKSEDRIKGLIGLNVQVRKLIEMQVDGYAEEQLAEERKILHKLFDEFTKKFGYINSRSNAMAFDKDSSYFLLCSLEKYDKSENKFIGKADIFYKNTVNPVVEITKTDTSLEALAVSIAEKAKVDIPFMSNLCGLSEEQVIADCIEAEAIYELPLSPGQKEEGVYVTADEYLSGDIREKMAFAQIRLLMGEKKFERNYKALEAVLPKPLTATDISVSLGVNWIDTDIYQQFMQETFHSHHRDIKISYTAYTGEFNISHKSYDSFNPIVKSKFGTPRMNAYDILEATLNMRTVEVRDRVEDEDGKVRYVKNPRETEKAQAAQELIKDTFQRWIFADAERREYLVNKYNEMFNSYRVRDFDGTNLVLHGVNKDYSLYPHQRNAISRTIFGGNTLLAHVVGAGKTFEMVASAMESKYLGICNKSMICVPKHIVGQFANEFMALYPTANILVVTEKDFQLKNRKLFCSKIATGDYDAVIIGHSQLVKIPLSTARQIDYLRREIEEITTAISSVDADEKQSYSVKQMEKVKKNLQEKLNRLLDTRQDDVVTFEELGIDRLYVDEAHLFKNLYFHSKMSNVAGLSTTEAQKSTDLYFKCKYLDELTGGKGVVFATGTPVSNSMVELYTMQKYLQPHALERLGFEHFDAWAANFADITTAMELAPEGTGYRLKTRFSRFKNLPELMTMFKGVADIKLADDLNLDVPEAEFINVCAEPTREQKELIKILAERATAIRNGLVDPSDDNMLKITNDGRMIGLDQRLINPLLPDDESSKVNLCVAKVYEIWQSTADKKLTQMIFCDFSTPTTTKKVVELEKVDDDTYGLSPEEEFTDLYNDVKKKLVAKGVPAEEIAFIHDCNTDEKKQKLFAKVRQGDVRVLIGSTAKCGAGTNVQDLLYAVHHLDCPWRPADLEQREGRIIRQGNQNEKVFVYRYVTEGTFDAYLYQIIENKQKGISQIMTSKSPNRTCDDVDDAVLNYSEVKALCAGNPLVKEKMELEVEVAKLKRLQSAYLSERYELEDRLIKYYPHERTRAELLVSNTKTDLKLADSHPASEDFCGIKLKGQLYTERKEAGEMLIKLCRTVGITDLPCIGEYKGFLLSLSFNSFGGGEYYLKLHNQRTYSITLGPDAVGNIMRIENFISKGLQKEYDIAVAQLEKVNSAIKTAEKMLEEGGTWEREEELTQKSLRLKEVDRLIMLDDEVISADENSDELDEASIEEQ